ncbi:hypothetical protein KAFR_0K00340 [Kazachstania africana CBS 2517]|uniref:Uncharacterized protein n=1 Tax=Kazachstania africana (strain ATCC 22294 / BCRC 22015 / CBS 2517 / CECT 1963 / NBRC 1671 / NRRL Y-8276) TaxID=1071382 RepID=H2B189_KAZAF|nr:hypothetical protein KAFR_0K00340 [Kazachstania africana CBS 2517]CCF60389.1 hypothetical protein KAFR_0K00340 [Kazachstania africana CBS 2517]
MESKELNLFDCLSWDLLNNNEFQDSTLQQKTTIRNISKQPKNRRSKKDKLFSTPDNLSDALVKDQNKLIHLDPVPIFRERSEIKPWLQKIFFPQGIDLVIERSDSSKVIFKCKANPNRTCKSESTSRCPFRIRATFSIKLQKWNIVVVNNIHSHKCKFNPNSEEYKKFKKYLKDNNDIDTIKLFEEFEYKFKFNLPIFKPNVIKCDCGLTKEISLFNNIVLPINKPSKESLLLTKTKKITKKSTLTNNSNSTSHSNNNKIKIKTENFIDFNTNANLLNNNQSFGDDVTNLNEIDFTNMFKLEEKEPESLSIENFEFETSNNDILSEFIDFNDDDNTKTVSTESELNDLSYFLNVDLVNDPVNMKDLDSIATPNEFIEFGL